MNTRDKIENTDIYRKCLLIFNNNDIETIKLIAIDIILEADYENYINNIDVDDDYEEITEDFFIDDEDYDDTYGIYSK